uniref:Uncharacterized protein n=1 Tax=Plectus sambesii TaxID=2011161 RepID=A0A914VG44_9BILA
MEQLVELLRKQLDASEKRADERAAAEAKLEAKRVAEEAKREEKWAAAEAKRHAADLKHEEDRKAKDAILRAEYVAATQALLARIDALSTQQLLEAAATPLHTPSTQERIMHSFSQRFDKTVNLLTELFNKPISLFHRRYCCLTLLKNEEDDMMTYMEIVNKQCEQFKLADLTIDQFKCLIFVCGLQSTADANVRTKILHQMEINPGLTLNKVGQLCTKYKKLMGDAPQMVHSHSSQAEEAGSRPAQGLSSPRRPTALMGRGEVLID